jgi:hypothetical protein
MSPFNLETEKRAKFNENSTEAKEFKPFVQLVQESFNLRPDNHTKDMANVELENMINPCHKKCSVKKCITKPISPKF